MRKTAKVSVSLLLCFLLATPFELAQAQTRDSHTIFRFNEIPHPDYYSRSFNMVGLRPVRDVTNTDSDQIIRDNPQSQRGFQAHWLRPDQAVAAVNKLTVVTCIGGSGEVVRITLKIGEAVAYDLSTGEILSIIRCANKCIEGKIELPAPKIVEKMIEKPVYVPKPEFRVVEKPVYIERPAPGLITPPVKRTTDKKRGWLVPALIIGGGVGGGILAAVLLSGGHPTPVKTYPRERVISP